MVSLFGARRVEDAALALEQCADHAPSGLGTMKQELLAATAELMPALENCQWHDEPGGA